MMLNSLFRSLNSRGPAARAKRRSSRATQARLVSSRLLLERLEDRTVPSFLAARAYDVGPIPQRVAVGDVNGDGIPDLATADVGSETDPGSVSVLLGNGDGSFQAARNFPAGSNPWDVAVGDVNRDGVPDLAVADSAGFGGSPGVSVLLGNGDGTFQSARFFTAGLRSVSVVVRDFNSDGLPDLAVANNGSNYVSVLLGNGDGSFQAARNFFSRLFSLSMAVGDFNGDGRADLAIARTLPDGGVSVLLGNGDGTFQPASFLDVGASPQDVAVGDFNGDGFLDLAVANLQSANVVLLGNGDGTFQPRRSIPTDQGNSVALGDFNGDGLLDLAVAISRNRSTVSLLLGNGDGTFQAPRHFAAATLARYMAVGDLNGDGRLDLTVADQYSFSVMVWLGNGDGTFQTARAFPTGARPESVAVGEFNGDGFLDLAVANYDSYDVSVLLGNGDGTFQAARTFAVGSQVLSVSVGEFNGDGILDVVVANYMAFPGNVSVLLGNGDGTFQTARTFPGGGVAVTVGDFNRDGLLDVVTGVVILLGNGDGTFQAARDHGGLGSSVTVADLNADGILDLALTNRLLHTVNALLGNGDGTFRATGPFAGRGPSSVVVGDVNGDGFLDLAVANRGTLPASYTDGSVSVLLGNGDGTFQTARDFPAGRVPRSVAVGDVNGDGLLDLVVASYGGARVLLGNGDGTFQTTAFSYVAGNSPQAVAVADFDGDGWSDLAAVNNASNDVSILLNAADDAAFFYLDAPAAVPAGQPFDLTVYALSGDWQRLAHGYRGTVALWSSDEVASLPEPYAFRAEDQGVVSIPGGVTLRTPGTQYLVAFDLETFTVIGYAVVDVLGTAPGGGGGGPPFSAAGCALAQAGLDLLTWTRPRTGPPITAGTASPVRG